MATVPTLSQSSTTEWINWLMRRRRLMRVTGRSMMPLLQPGDLLFLKPLQPNDELREGTLIVAHHPQQANLKIIKRINTIFADSRYFLMSDNPMEGTDSRSFGAVERSSIVGIITGYAVKAGKREGQ